MGTSALRRNIQGEERSLGSRGRGDVYNKLGSPVLSNNVDGDQGGGGGVEEKIITTFEKVKKGKNCP